MEYGSKSTDGAGGCVAYPERWPLVSSPRPEWIGRGYGSWIGTRELFDPNGYGLEAGNPYKELQIEMEKIPYIPPNPYDGWCFPWWSIYPPFFMNPEWNGRVYTWTDSTGGISNA